ncbi:hypothetical protein EIN_044450 [Entamoeba invadens IP1]|uniref:Uncharacterized protein n=1 Tax=Entamoeba invadens IP1 TaxID=370355 RepID=A0A0A1TZ87_ENTIV|nr:hypothetical protein EIN_044450 [Entamoeba invadens IP1]ELP86887.1 hypothetical protein EIN_044450 [Entamoeba invadens IP1]|eukprot:XP_004253658.1 hypothetical protein EIN_044450 [Entamoeba invadens IP1]
MGNTTGSGRPSRLSFQEQAQITRLSLPAQHNQLTRSNIEQIIPLMRDITNVLKLGAVSKKCASSIILSKKNPFYSPDTLKQELIIFSGIKVVQTSVQHLSEVPNGKTDYFYSVKINYESEEDIPVNWNLYGQSVLLLELQVLKDVEFNFKLFKSLQRVKLIFWATTSKSSMESMVESLLFCDSLKSAILEVDTYIEEFTYALHQLTLKRVFVVLKLNTFSEIDYVQLFQNTLDDGSEKIEDKLYRKYLHLSTHSIGSLTHVLTGEVCLLPDENGLTLPLSRHVEDIEAIAWRYLPTTLKLKGTTQSDINTFKSSIKSSMKSSVKRSLGKFSEESTQALLSLNLTQVTSLTSLTLEDIKVFQTQTVCLPSSLCALNFKDVVLTDSTQKTPKKKNNNADLSKVTSLTAMTIIQLSGDINVCLPSSLKRFEGYVPSNQKIYANLSQVESLKIHGELAESVPESVTELTVYKKCELTRCTKLRELTIERAEKFRSLPRSVTKLTIKQTNEREIALSTSNVKVFVLFDSKVQKLDVPATLQSVRTDYKIQDVGRYKGSMLIKYK